MSASASSSSLAPRPEAGSEATPRYARARAAASYFQIGKSTLWAWVANRPGFPQPVKAGPKTTLFDLNAIDAFLKAQVQPQPGGEAG